MFEHKKQRLKNALYEGTAMAATQAMSCAGAKSPLKVRSFGTSSAPRWPIQFLILLASAAFSAAQGNISPGEPTALFKRCCSFQGQETSRLSKHFSEPARATVRNFNWKQVCGWLVAEKGSWCSLNKPWGKDVHSVRGKECGHEVWFSKEDKGRESRGSASSLQCFNVIMKVYYF